MAKKTTTKYNTSYSALVKKLSGDKVVPNHLIFLQEKILFDDLIKTAARKFLGQGYRAKEQVRYFFTDDKSLDAVLTETSNISFFPEPKIIILKVVRKPGYKGFSDKEKAALTHYFDNPNPEIMLIILDAGEEPNFAAYEGLEHKNLDISMVGAIPESEYVDWVKSKFEGYTISDETINHFIQFLNFSFDEISQEIEKLKVYCLEGREVTIDAVNLCIGFSKDFNEFQFIEAVLTRDQEKALQIYEKLVLKKDVEIYLLVLLNSAFIAINKLQDPKTYNLHGWDLMRALKIWGGGDRMVRIYKDYHRQINEFKLKMAFDYIYEAEKLFKTSNPDKKTVFIRLINGLTSL